MCSTRKLMGFMVIALVFSFGINSYAQTPDKVTPAVDDVCEGLVGALYGLCNAYCEAKDCDTEKGYSQHPKACDKNLINYQKMTYADSPPCDCGVECINEETTQCKTTGDQCRNDCTVTPDYTGCRSDCVTAKFQCKTNCGDNDTCLQNCAEDETACFHDCSDEFLLPCQHSCDETQTQCITDAQQICNVELGCCDQDCDIMKSLCEKDGGENCDQLEQECRSGCVVPER